MKSSLEADLDLLHLKEDPARLEKAIVLQQDEYDRDLAVKDLLDSIYLEKDREGSFRRFFQSREFATIQKLLSFFGVSRESDLCEIGGGPGFLAWSLLRSGYPRVDLVEPNVHYTTGTGYLRSRGDIAGLTIHADLDQCDEPYDTILTKNCIHHFPNIAWTAACIRQKMKPGALWFAFREWYADSAAELYTLLAHHPYSQRYGLYEWAYPASHYVDAIEIAGFSMIACVPANYENNCLAWYSEEPVPRHLQKWTDQIDRLLQRAPHKTVKNFWHEVKRNKFDGKQHRTWSRPQAMVFQRL